MATLHRIRARSAAVINLTGVFEKADEVILPAMYNYISRDFHASPSEMAAITVCRGLTQALTSPIGGVLGALSPAALFLFERVPSGSVMNRIRVILFGCLIWATMTWLFGISRWVSHPFTMGAIVWALNGLGLSLVIPNSQSVIADYYAAEERGRAFGLLMLNANLGAVLGSVFATNLAGVDTQTFRGWQLVMFILAVLSAFIGWLNLKFAHDPRRDDRIRSVIAAGGTEEEQRFLKEIDSSDDADPEQRKSWGEITTAISTVFHIPTFCIIILQGVVGSMPWKALGAFATLYLQLIGMSDFQAAVVYGLFLTGTAVGAWVGGYIGDKASALSPNHGRIFACQFSVFSGIPLMVVIFKTLPRDGSAMTAVYYCLVLFVTGLLISWAAPCCNSPIFAEIVHPTHRNIIYAFDRCLEDALASPVSFLVGLAAEQVWGFEGDATASKDLEKDLEKADALSQSLMWFSVVPWTLCLLFYSGLHFTYRKDKRQFHSSSDD